MDRLNLIRAEAGPGLDVSAASDIGFHTADNSSDGSTKFLSFTDDDDLTPKKMQKNVGLGESTPCPAVVDSGFGASLSPIPKHDGLGLNIGGQIDANNILSGQISIFDDCNSNDGDELVIDVDAVGASEESEVTEHVGSEKVICERNESANLSVSADATLTLKEISESQQLATQIEEDQEKITEHVPNNNEVILQIDGKNVDALDIGNGLYLYRKNEGGELNAVQILEEGGQSPNFKFLKVRQMGETNLEVYEEHILEVPITEEELEQEKKKGKKDDNKYGIHKMQKCSHLPISDVQKALNHDPVGNTSKFNNTKDDKTSNINKCEEMEQTTLSDKQSIPTENINPLKNIEGSRKSPILGNFTSMTLHSSSNRDGAPPTKTMINFPINSCRISDSVKKTIEVSTDKATAANIMSKIIERNIDELKNSPNTKADKNELIASTTKPDNDLNEQLEQARTEIPVNTINMTDVGQNHSTKNILGEKTPKNMTEFKEIYERNEEMKMELSKVNFPNVVSKWVLRSDSIEEKYKKDRDSCSDSKPIPGISTSLASEISKKKGLIETESKKQLNVSYTGKDSLKVDCKETKERNVKTIQSMKHQQIATTPNVVQGHGIAQDMLYHHGKSDQNLGPLNRKSIHSLFASKIEKAYFKAEETAKEHVTKYGNESLNNFGYIKGSHQDKLSNSDNNTLLKNLSQHNTICEPSNKPVPFGKWTEGDKRQYLDKIKDKKLTPKLPSSSPVKSYKLANAKNDLKRLEQKNSAKADSFESMFLSKYNLPDDIKAEGKPNRDVDMKGVIDKTIEGLIMETLGSAGKPPVMNHINTGSPNSSEKNPDENPKAINNLSSTGEKSSEVTAKGTFTIEKTEEQPEHLNPFPSHQSNKIPELIELPNSRSKTDNDSKPCYEISSAGNNVEEDDSDDEVADSEPVTGDMQWPNVVTVEAVQKMLQDNTTKSKEEAPKREMANEQKKKTQVVSDSLRHELKNSTSQTVSTVPSTTNDNKHKIARMLDSAIPSANSLTGNMNTTSSLRFPHVYQGNISVSHAKDRMHSSDINLQTKVKIAYQSALSAKSQKDPPVKIIDSQCVKVSHLSSKVENIQMPIPDMVMDFTSKQTTSISSLVKPICEGKFNDSLIPKPKQPRKQVLTPVESPPIEIVKTSDHDDMTIKRKRKIDLKQPKHDTDVVNAVPVNEPKTMTPKKKYLLGRTPIQEERIKDDTTNKVISDEIKQTLTSGESDITHVKVAIGSAEFNTVKSIEKDGELAQIVTPRRGRGRPRKHPVECSPKNTQKCDASKGHQPDNIMSDNDPSTTSLLQETETGGSDIEEVISENWTMGKINDKIVCPICNKLFRTEAIVFKHVKHCSTLMKSPNKRTITVAGDAGEVKKGKLDHVIDKDEIMNITVQEQIKESISGTKENTVKTSVIVIDSPSPMLVSSPIEIEDSPIPCTSENPPNTTKDTPKSKLSRPKGKVGRPRSTSVHTCEICSKTFRQLSYLVHHRNQHKKDPPPKAAIVSENKPLSCEVCSKVFRKLHHLVEHREIHNATLAAAQRKRSVEQKVEVVSAKIADPPASAGFRCEPCDKSFRKLHHLVEHRETHDGVLRLKNSPPQPQPPQPPQDANCSFADTSMGESPTCEVCGKSFRKLHHLIEHRETHVEQRERKSSLVARDIIHECSLCYMVFPNEPSLNKHRGNCIKKKKVTGDHAQNPSEVLDESKRKSNASESMTIPLIKVDPPPDEPSPPSPKAASTSAIKPDSKQGPNMVDPKFAEKADKSSKEPNTTPNQKVASTSFVRKPANVSRKRSTSVLPPVTEVQEDEGEIKSKDSDDEPRYMLNPSFEDSDEEKEIFVNICATKRNSLQFDAPNADPGLKKRRTSLQHLPMTKPLPKKPENTSKSKQFNPSVPSRSVTKDSVKPSSIKITPAMLLKTQKKEIPMVKRSSVGILSEQRRKSLTGIAKRKSLGRMASAKPSIAKPAPSITKPTRSVAKLAPSVTKSTPSVAKSASLVAKSAPSVAKSAPSVAKSARPVANSAASTKQIAAKTGSSGAKPAVPAVKPAMRLDAVQKKKQVCHVCDCGAPFSSATLLAHHTSVAHTPPRVRRARDASPPPHAAAKSRRLAPKHSGVPVAFTKTLDK